MRPLAGVLLGILLHVPALASHPAAPAPAADAAAPRIVEEKITLPLFGATTVYRPEEDRRIRGVILFLSGDGGWNLGVVDMARRSAGEALVVGLSMPAWRKAVEKDAKRCWFPAGDLESTAQAIEKRYRLPRYVKPVVVGYSSGATAVFAALAQGPAETFAGGVSLGFCPDLEVARPVCARGSWEPSYEPKKKRSLLPPRPDLAPRADGVARWTALQGTVDKVCDPTTVDRFVSRIAAARVVPLPKVGHGFSVTARWGAAYDAAVADLLEKTAAYDAAAREPSRTPPEQSPEAIRQRLDPLDLPLEIIWPERARSAIIFFSGDGGWAELDQEVAAALAARGVAVVGWNSLRYFWSARTPEESRADLSRLVEALPEEVTLFLGGYSFGAEVTPVLMAPDGADPPAAPGPLSRIAGLVLLAPGPHASFEVSPLDWFRSQEPPIGPLVSQAIEAGHGRPVLCLEPDSGDDSGCPKKALPGLRKEVLPGGHHFAGRFDALAEKILGFLTAVGEISKAQPGGA